MTTISGFMIVFGILVIIANFVEIFVRFSYVLILKSHKLYEFKIILMLAKFNKKLFVQRHGEKVNNRHELTIRYQVMETYNYKNLLSIKII